jgi:hypothetical protein
MKKVGLSDFFILIYLLISSTAFLVNFVINLRAARNIGRKSRDLPLHGDRDTGQLEAAEQPAALKPVQHTTRSFEPVLVREKRDEN